jgi:hypothetical protein
MWCSIGDFTGKEDTCVPVKREKGSFNNPGVLVYTTKSLFGTSVILDSQQTLV